MLLALTGLAAAAAGVSYAGYASMAPHSQLYGRTLTHGRNPRQIALTYDDGPNDPHTLHLLDVLDKFRVKATFFLIGKYVRQRPDIVRNIRAAGHTLGNHTFNHPNLIFVSPAGVRRELEHCRKALEDAVGERQLWFRPPFWGQAALCVADLSFSGDAAGDVVGHRLRLECAISGSHRRQCR